MRRALVIGGKVEPEFVDIGPAASTGIFSLTRPTVAAGDLMLAVFARSSSWTTLTPPSGWASLVTDPNSRPLRIYGKIATASEPTTSSWSTDTGGGAVIVAYRGVPLATPVAAAAAPGFSTAFTAPSVTAPAPSLLLYLGYADSSGVTFTGPPGMTARTAATGTRTFRIAEELTVPAGATGTRTATASKYVATSTAALVAIPL